MMVYARWPVAKDMGFLVYMLGSFATSFCASFQRFRFLTLSVIVRKT